MGVEGLGKAKLSYQPEMLLMKYSVWSSCTVKAEIEECGLTPELHLIKWQTRALWSLCFGDTEEFMKLYFTRKYTPERNSCLVRDGRVVAALQRLPYRMMFGGGVVPVAYVSGVCTQPECRGKGLMTELMGQAHRKMYADGCLFSLLIPADEGLFAFYHRFGYYTCPEVALSEWEVSYDTDKVVCEVYTTMHEVEPVLGDLQSYLDAFLRRVPYAVLHDEADLYTVCAFPVGGLCQFDGEDEEALENDPRRFNAQPVWKRFIVILAGPFMNILTAFLIAFVFYLCKPMPVYAVDPVTHYEVQIVASVKENSPAEKAGLKNGDVIIAINGQYPTETADTDIYSSVSALIGAAGNDFVMTVERSGAQLDLAVSDAFNSTENRTVIGITISGLVEDYRHLNVLQAAAGSGEYLVLIVKATAQGIAGMFKHGIHSGDISGVVGTVGIMVDVARESMINLVNIAVILSLSLGLFNLIPFPALDGGRLLFLLIEAIIHRPLNRKVEAIVNAVGLALLFTLMIVVTISDVVGLFR